MRYIYNLYRKDSDEEPITFYTVDDISDYTGYPCMTITNAIKQGRYFSNYFVEKKPFDENSSKPKGCIVIFPNGNPPKTYKSQHDCAKELGISVWTISRHIQSGTPDKSGRFYDLPLD